MNSNELNARLEELKRENLELHKTEIDLTTKCVALAREKELLCDGIRKLADDTDQLKREKAELEKLIPLRPNPLAILGCDCAACKRLRELWLEDHNRLNSPRPKEPVVTDKPGYTAKDDGRVMIWDENGTWTGECHPPQQPQQEGE